GIFGNLDAFHCSFDQVLVFVASPLEYSLRVKRLDTHPKNYNWVHLACRQAASLMGAWPLRRIRTVSRRLSFVWFWRRVQAKKSSQSPLTSKQRSCSKPSAFSTIQRIPAQSKRWPTT